MCVFFIVFRYKVEVLYSPVHTFLLYCVFVILHHHPPILQKSHTWVYQPLYIFVNTYGQYSKYIFLSEIICNWTNSQKPNLFLLFTFFYWDVTQNWFLKTLGTTCPTKPTENQRPAVQLNACLGHFKRVVLVYTFINTNCSQVQVEKVHELHWEAYVVPFILNVYVGCLLTRAFEMYADFTSHENIFSV